MSALENCYLNNYIHFDTCLLEFCKQKLRFSITYTCTNYHNISKWNTENINFRSLFFVLYFERKKENNKNNTTVSKREFTEQHISKFNKMLSKEDWKTVNKENDASCAFLKF